jgi:putative membrane protein
MTAILAPIGWGLPIVWGLTGVAFWILLIVLIVLLVRGLRTTASASGGSAIRLVEERYARGEITREELLERRAVLVEAPPASRATTRNSRLSNKPANEDPWSQRAWDSAWFFCRPASFPHARRRA